MPVNTDLPASRDKLLLTPGPLSTSRTVKLAMQRDLGSRDGEFLDIVHSVRESLLTVAGVSRARGYEAVLMQGSGTFAVESVISSVVPRTGKLLVVTNGAYGRRLGDIAQVHGIRTAEVASPENVRPQPNDVARTLKADQTITRVACVHCETTSGIMNPVREIGQVVSRAGRRYLVDSMSAFGAVPLDLEASHVDYLVASANKCIEGVPGFAFVICRRDALLESKPHARTLSLDLFGQWDGFERTGQFRFTPPTHSILAFQRALEELELEGGVTGRARRYEANHRCLIAGMREIGFQEYLPSDRQGCIITSFLFPAHPHFDFDQFYGHLRDKGFVIYPGKVNDAHCFRVGTIGRIFEADIRVFLVVVRATLREMGVELQ